MKAFLIARVSTLDQSDALPGQTYRLKDYSARKEFEEELFEIRESAYKGNRASFKQVIDKIMATDETCVVVFDKIDRYTRDSNSKEVSILNNLCRVGKIELHFPSDNLYITKSSSAQEHFMLNMGVSNAQYYSDSISDNVKRRFQQKRRDGEWCGKAPVGYINTVKLDGKKWIEPDPKNAPMVKETFELYATGNYSLREIAKRWREKYGLSTVQTSRIEQVLKNPFYYGEMKSKGETYAHAYTPIITRKLFEQAKATRDGFKIQPKRWGGLPFPYRGLIHCAECGCIVTFEVKKKKYIYGHCTRKKNKHPMKYVTESEMTKQIKDILKKIQVPIEAYERASALLKKSYDDGKLSYEKSRSLIDADIKKYQSHKERVYEDFLDGKIPEYLYEKKFSEFDLKLKLKQEQRESLELMDDEQYASSSHLLKLAVELPELFEKGDPMQKRTILNLIVSNFQLDQDLLRWKYKKPFDTMALCNESQNWLRRLDSNQ